MAQKEDFEAWNQRENSLWDEKDEDGRNPLKPKNFLV